MSMSLKVVLIAAGFAVAFGPQAEAAKKRKQVVVAPPPAGVAVAPRQGAGLFPPGPVYFGRDYFGYDPDPFIRSQILRDTGVHYGGDS